MGAIQQRRVKQKCNVQFYNLIESKKRFKVHQGGTRSGKTYAVCQYIAYLLVTEKRPLIISIIRKTLPALKGSAQRDMLGILEQTGLLYMGEYNKSTNIFEYGKHQVEFMSVDQPQKIRGRKRSIAFLNEANELDLEDFRQINMRTTDMMILDFNPSDPVHWIYDEVIPREDCDTWITTYQDNKYLGEDLVKEIERMKERDYDYWRVYGEGQRAVLSKRQIYTNWAFIPLEDFPEVDEKLVGIDFGFSNDETAIVEVQKSGDRIYIHEICYRKGMTARDIVDFLIERNLQETLCIGDSARPEIIEEMRRMGIWAKGSKKGQGSVNAGISFMKEHEVFVSNESKNIKKEYTSYLWEELKDGTIINKPRHDFSHGMDAIRYAIYTQYSNRTNFFVI